MLSPYERIGFAFQRLPGLPCDHHGLSKGTTIMAKRTVHMLIDDLDGGAADETITFALDGTGYEIDLSRKNAGKLRDALSKFVAAGTKIGRVSPAGSRGATARGRISARSDRNENR